MPTKVIAAEEDIVDTVTESQQLINGIENAILSIIPGGHSSPLEQPKVVAKLVIEFLEKN